MIISSYRLLILTMFLSLCGCAAHKPMHLAQNVDLTKYMGKWHEIARLPNKFQRGCSCSTAEYKILDDTYIAVINQCYKGNKLVTATGKAWRNGSNSKLKVRFFWPFTGNYWILYISDNYRYAVVGEPSREYLWFLTKDQSVDKKQLAIMKSVALKNGYDLRKLIESGSDCH